MRRSRRRSIPPSSSSSAASTSVAFRQPDADRHSPRELLQPESAKRVMEKLFDPAMWGPQVRDDPAKTREALAMAAERAAAEAAALAAYRERIEVEKQAIAAAQGRAHADA